MSPKKIFVVEDDPDIQCIVEYLLSGIYYTVYICPTVRVFRERLLADRPDLIILDVMLPDGNGAALCDELKSSEVFQSIPVLMMSAHLSNAAITSCQPDLFIEKPFDIHLFRSKVDALTGLQELKLLKE